MAKWVTTQRQAYKGKNGRKITEEQINLLREIGFSWSRGEDKWNERFDQLEEYTKENGHCNVPDKYPANQQLANWVMSQRQAKKKQNKRKLSDEKIKLLDEIGFEWTRYSQIVSWDERFEQLKGYKKDHGDCNVPRNYKANPQLARWIGTQRTAFKNGKLLKERIESLQGIGFSWVISGCSRPAVVEVSDVEDSASDEEEEAGGATSSARDTQIMVPLPPLAILPKDNGEKDSTAAERDEIAQSSLAPVEDEEDERGGDGSSFVVDEDDNNDQNRNGLAASVASMQDEQEVKLAHSRQITQLKETHEKSMDDLKTSHTVHTKQMEELVKDTKAELEVVKGVYEKKIEQIKASQKIRQECYLASSVAMISALHEAHQLRHKVEVSKLRKELDAARAKLPKAVSHSSRIKRKSTRSLGTDMAMAADHEVVYTHN